MFTNANVIVEPGLNFLINLDVGKSEGKKESAEIFTESQKDSKKQR